VLIYKLGTAAGTQQLSWYDRSGKRANGDITPLGTYSSPSLSPDGKRLAYGVVEAGNGNLWIQDLEKKLKTVLRLTQNRIPHRGGRLMVSR
jgi:Tol biopolymer transport system component